jgi:hypothetical protein
LIQPQARRPPAALLTCARSPAGILFEPERESKELFERWYAGGTLS